MTIAYVAVYVLFAPLFTAVCRRHMRSSTGQDPLVRDASAAIIGLVWPLALPLIALLAVANASRPPRERSL